MIQLDAIPTRESEENKAPRWVHVPSVQTNLSKPMMSLNHARILTLQHDGETKHCQWVTQHQL